MRSYFVKLFKWLNHEIKLCFNQNRQCLEKILSKNLVNFPASNYEKSSQLANVTKYQIVVYQQIVNSHNRIILVVFTLAI